MGGKGGRGVSGGGGEGSIWWGEGVRGVSGGGRKAGEM